MRGLLFFIILTTFGHAAFSQFAHDDSTRYIYDNRTYGTRGFAARLDSDFLFPTYPSARTFSTQTAAHLYWVAPADQLHVFYGGVDHIIGTGGGGGLTGAVNGLDVEGTLAILGYAAATPNLFRSVYIKTGPTASFGINFDSLAAAGGADSVLGSFLVVGMQSPFSTGRFFEAGYNGGTSGLNTNVEVDSTGASLNAVFASGSSNFLILADNNFFLEMNDGANIQYNTGLFPEPMQFFSHGGILAQEDQGSLEMNTALTGKTATLNNIFQLDAGNAFAFRHLAAYGDSLAATGGTITAVFNAALDVNPTPGIGYTTSGEDASFTLTFTTGTVTASSDSVVVRISLASGSEDTYSVTCMAFGNKASGTAYTSMVPFYSIDSKQTFNLCSAATNTVIAFSSNTTYNFSFHVIDHTTQ